MEPVLTAQAQREADRLTIDDFGVSGLTLMETAGRAVAAQIEKILHPIAGKRVDILAGKGNNGGDGYVIARVLHALGARVRVWTTGSAEDMSPDAVHHRRLVETLPDHALSLQPLADIVSLRTDLCVDALLGTGLSRPLRPELMRVVGLLNAQPAPVVAVDIPTGLHADTGAVLGAAVRADCTVTMGSLKPGLLLNHGPEYAGRTISVDIGIPPHILHRAQGDYGAIWRTTNAGVRALLPARPRSNIHKYSAGMALVVGGSPGLTGAAIMASRAAARVGAGYVTCATQASVQPTLATRFTATTTLALPEDTTGNLAVTPALNVLAPFLRRARALLVGPGLGDGAGTRMAVRALLQSTSLPAVVDADGLNSWVGFTNNIARYAQGRWIFTPHGGELDRLTGGADCSDVISAARHWAKSWNVVLIAKGIPSIVATPEGQIFICGSGNSALATAGTGDVLAGMCAGLLAQGLSPVHAAVAGLHLGGMCADYYCETQAARSMVATDLLSVLPRVIKMLDNGEV